MGDALLIGVVETLLEALKSTKARERFRGNEDILDPLRSALSTAKSMLLGADYQSREYLSKVEKMKDTVYDLEDLLEKLFVNNRKVPCLLRRIKGSTKKLTKRVFSKVELDSLSIRTCRNMEIHSFVDKECIIGREVDKEAIVEMLLSHPNCNSDSYTHIVDADSVVAVVGMAGLGKTCLAQLVYNDARIKSDFDIHLWHCGFGIDERDANSALKAILQGFILLNSPPFFYSADVLPLDELARLVRDALSGKRYFLVLDDVWCEDPLQWTSLRNLLRVAGRGSKILVTTRSRMVADACRATHIHDLKVLSDEDSWNLFKRLAFRPEEDYGDEIVQIAQEATQICANLPLAIIMTAKFFCRTDKCDWVSFKTVADLPGFQDQIIPHLWLSYRQLPPELKSCFGFCSIFPEDYVIQKQVLISMWISMGYIRTTLPNNMESIAERYCSTLMGRSFFHAFKQDEHGEVISFKMHNFMRILALQSAGTECLTLPAAVPTSKIRHLTISEYASVNNALLDKSFRNLHTIFSSSGHSWCSSDSVATIISKCKRLRILHLRNMGLKSLPDTFNKVPHLRYLDLSDNEELEMLPPSITKLGNLQTLRLSGCKNLKELPKDMGKLVNLRNLNIDGCNKLTSMPTGLDNLTSRQASTMSVVCGDQSYRVSRDLQMRSAHLTAVLKKVLELKARDQLGKYADRLIMLQELLKNFDFLQQDFPDGFHDWLEEVKDTVYNGEDLFDELINTPKVHRLLPKIQDWSEKLESVCRTFPLKIDGLLWRKRGVKRRREETISDVEEVGIVGRDGDKEALVEMLLSLSNSDTISVVGIVGMAGLGKTVLGQLVFNDARIKCDFDLFFWVCVSGMLDVNRVMGPILNNNAHEFSFAQLEMLVDNKLCGKRYLLVLDDVWCEDPQKCEHLMSFFRLGGRGSCILVTTRSRMVADAFRATRIHELKALSDQDSLTLFKRLAFRPEDYSVYALVQIAKEIAKKCANLPLIIRVMASFFYHQGRSNWPSFKTVDLAELSLFQDEIMPHLWFSYDQLTPELMCCFRLCSIFPNGYVMQKQVLISMWISMGYLHCDQNSIFTLENTGEEYCSTLLARSFFQPVQQDEYGEVISFKMHDAMRILAQQSAGTECMTLTAADAYHLPRKIRHLWISEYSSFNVDLLDESCEKLRTIICSSGYHWCSSDGLDKIMSHCRYLRILHMRNMGLKTLPDTFNKVPLLTYLDLSDNEELNILPPSITQLGNLQTLILSGCKNLKELPEDIGTLSNLRYVDLFQIQVLEMLPASTTKLLDLQTLILSGCKNLKELPQDIGTMLNLRHVDLSGNQVLDILPASITELLNLQTLKLSGCNNLKELLEDMGALLNLSKIVIEGYQGTTLPSWELERTTSFSKLASIELSHFNGLKHLTGLSQLSHLKYLYLRRMWDIECIESNGPSTTSGDTEFFPSLVKLVLEWMPNLKGWWKDLTWMQMQPGGGCLVDGNGRSMEHLILPSFPRLHDLDIHCCQAMMYIPPCPNVKSLQLKGVNEAMTFCRKGGHPTICLEKLNVCYDARVFKSVVQEFVVPGTIDVNLKYFYEEQSLGIAREAFQRCASSLRCLSIDGFYKLKSLSGGGIEHLTNLESLSIKGCSTLDLDGMEMDMEEEGMPWKSLQSLSTLKLSHISNLVNLPKAFQYLTSLQSLHIIGCKNLEVLGESVCYLTSLKSLHIEDCKNLKTLPECLSSLMSLQPPYITNCPKLELP